MHVTQYEEYEGFDIGKNETKGHPSLRINMVVDI